MGEGELLHRELSFAVIGCAQRVHRTLGPGFPESVYHNALCVEFQRTGIAFESEASASVEYETVCCGEFRMDIVVDNRIILELKALDRLAAAHPAQLLSYLKATALHVGILLNFGTERLEVKRVVL